MFNVREYDFCLSLGGSCAPAMQLKQRGLRLASLPFDWVRGRESATYADRVASLVESHFAGWCAYENLVPMPEELDRPKATDPLEVRTWDKVQEIGFYHDFRFDIFGKGGREYYEAIAARYRRRIERLYDVFTRADRLLAIIVGPDAPIPHEDVACLKLRLEAVRPGVSVTLVALNFCAKEDRTTGSLDEGLLVRDMTRELHAYDFVKTSWEWDFLEDVKLSGKIAAMKDEKRNATKGMSFWYRIHRKLFLHCKKVLERSNAHVK